MYDVNSGAEFINQAKLEARDRSVRKTDPLLHESMQVLEQILVQEQEMILQREDEIESGVVQRHEGYEFDEEEFKACIPRVVEMLKLNGEIPESAVNAFDRAKYADDWYVFSNALCVHAISCDTSDMDLTDPRVALLALGDLMIDGDFCQKYLEPHHIYLHRHDVKSPYNGISKDLSLPCIVMVMGIINYRMPVTTTLTDIWWFNVLDEAHSRWEKILGAAQTLIEEMGVENRPAD